MVYPGSVAFKHKYFYSPPHHAMNHTDFFLEERRLRQLVYRPDDVMVDRNKGWFLPPLIDDDGEDAIIGPDPRQQLQLTYDAHKHAEIAFRYEIARRHEIACHQAEIARRQAEIARHQAEIARQAQLANIKSQLTLEAKVIVDMCVLLQQFLALQKGGHYEAQSMGIYHHSMIALQHLSEAILRPLLQQQAQLERL